ncbi:MAG: ABC transporter ATP-binding protein [Planctomycetota bacterium]|jgi:branched-chain amino acid transport system ATP-binding protein|nr:ABC transporter ATP-binding protein [Planctomycetota bacterium]MDP7134358.1 ABC transporter ATP-binding protein [Planctomycetota bacterium]MDP7254100.1 ABC transporter ATP-binding protein [Planctomycetota bacterium]
MPEPILQLEEVVAGYGQMETLKGISLDVKIGEIVTIIGANGAGKTTTLNTICGIVKTRSGAIRLSNERIDRSATVDIVKRGLTQVPEGRRLFSDMTVRENLEMGAFLRKDDAGIVADMQKCFDTFPVLRERQSQLAGSLSGGEQQMCAIARSLMARPAVLLLDEPSLGLAPMIVRQIFDVIVQLNERGTTILLVEQNANMALGIAHRGYVMETGQITLSGDADDLLENEKVKQAYLGE